MGRRRMWHNYSGGATSFAFALAALQLPSLLRGQEVSRAKYLCTGSQTTFRECDDALPACPNPQCTDCRWAEWGPWGECNCHGLQERRRYIDTPASFCGRPCEGTDRETQTCKSTCMEQATDCELSEWTEWTECNIPDCSAESATTPQKYRERHVVREAQGTKAKLCLGALKETQSCTSEYRTQCEGVIAALWSHEEEHAQDCKVSEWSKWSACSHTCTGGQQSRSREVVQYPKLGGLGCGDGHSLPLDEVRACNEAIACPSTGESDGARDCQYSEWSEWETCSTSCGPGTQERRRDVTLGPLGNGKACEAKVLTQVQGCNVKSCGDAADCVVGPWSSWGECSATCNGVRNRTRAIETYPGYGGKACDAVLHEAQACNVEACGALQAWAAEKSSDSDFSQPQDCELSDWGDWSACEPACGPASSRRRTRKIASPSMNGGKECAEHLVLSEIAPCEDWKPCDSAGSCKLGEWEDWGDCSVSCGVGHMTRKRVVDKFPKLCGEACPRDTLEETKPCKGSGSCECVDAKLSGWSSWTSCSCLGLQERHRSIREHANHCGKPLDKGYSLVETKQCVPKDCGDKKQDCVLSRWSTWSECTATCGGGQQFRSRKIDIPSALGGEPCLGHLRETRECGMSLCTNPKDCEISAWTKWSDCTKSCDGGQEFRQRVMISGASHGGAGCADQLSEIRGCNLQPCSLDVKDCNWSEWSEWSACSQSCDGGYKQRDRAIAASPRHGGLPCEARAKSELAPCNTQRCRLECIDGKWDAWSEWSHCSASCGDGGVSTRHRAVKVWPSACGKGVEGSTWEVKECNRVPCEQSVDCQLSEWSSWSSCSSDCNGVRRRSREMKVEPANGGKGCGGPLEVIEGCNLPDDGYATCSDSDAGRSGSSAVIDCKMSEWGKWGKCTAVCDQGIQIRDREVETAASAGGKPCGIQPTREMQSCNKKPCLGPQDCAFSDWSEWSKCSQSCGGGMQQRIRVIDKVARRGGKPCELESTKLVRPCNEDLPCNSTGAVEFEHGNGSFNGVASSSSSDQAGQESDEVPEIDYSVKTDKGLVPFSPDQVCGWEPWSAWGKCSTTCGQGGVQARTRHFGLRPRGSDKETFYSEISRTKEENVAEDSGGWLFRVNNQDAENPGQATSRDKKVERIGEEEKSRKGRGFWTKAGLFLVGLVSSLGTLTLLSRLFRRRSQDALANEPFVLIEDEQGNSYAI
ncbi:unnamed protein product [Amoebophrya sp. A25]|nr:unnamed protein product [Amoebophrya sp. A25]|eukprot:GSA25T00020280001.1